MKILITGSEGLIGTHLTALLRNGGIEVAAFDKVLNAPDGRPLDTRDAALLSEALAGCDGVVHLAAVSRVLWGEQDPALCRDVNVGGTRNLCAALRAAPNRPFVIFGSSREVYGNPASLPVREDAPLAPCNLYGETKFAGEQMIRALADDGLATCVLRFSNVYGWTGDHEDRVIPAFARAAAQGGAIHVDGADCVFDFTHVADVAPAIMRAALRLAEGSALPEMHLVSGTGTTLGELAALARRESGDTLAVTERPPRDFDVARFYGDPSRAARELGWAPRHDLEHGFAALVAAFRKEVRDSAAIPSIRNSARA